MKDNKKRKSINVGTSLILVTFVILCLIAFGALSYSSAVADWSKTKQTADRNKNYYAAISKSQEDFKNCSELLSKVAHQSDSADEFFDNIQKTLSGDNIEIKKEDDVISICYYTSINENLSLQTTLATTYNNGDISIELLSEKEIKSED